MIVSLLKGGSSVIGTYTGFFDGPQENYYGSVTGTVQGGALIGTWYESGAPETTGPLEFVISSDGNSFAVRWARAPDSSGGLSNVTYRWNGARKESFGEFLGFALFFISFPK